MTIQASTPRVSFNCDGMTKVFPVPIQGYANTDFTVILTAPAGSGGAQLTLVLNSDYSLVPSGSLAPTAWTLTTLAVTAYAAGYTLQVFINPQQVQQTQYVQGQAFPSLAVQTNMDRLTQMVQRLQDEASRAIHAPDGDVSPNMLLPLPASRALTNLGFDSLGNLALNAVLAATTLSQASIGAFLYPQTQPEINAAVTPTALWYPPGDIRRYGAIGDGVTVNDTFIANALLVGQPVYFPAGTYLCNSSKTPIAGQKLYGDGMGKTIIKFKNTGAILAGFSVAVSNLTFSDLTIQVDVNGQTSCSAVTLSDVVDNLNFERVAFLGTTVKLNNWGVCVSNCTLTGFYMKRCRFELLDLPWFKANSDNSSQLRMGFTDCYATNCTDVFELNNGLSAGTMADITISGCHFDSIVQFAIGAALAGRISIIGNHFTNCSIDAVHIEAASYDITIQGNTFQKCNTTAGPGFGAVYIITGSTNITVSGNTFDLTQNVGGIPQGVYVAPGGGAAPSNIVITGNIFKCKAGANYAIVAANLITAVSGVATTGGVIISDNYFVNVSSASKATSFINAPNSVISGSNNAFFNPSVLLTIDDNTYGSIETCKISGDVTTFAFLSGNSAGQTGVCFNGFSITRAFTSLVAATPQIMFPQGSIFDLTVGVKFTQNVTTQAFVTTIKLDWDGTTLTKGTAKKVEAGSTLAPTAAQWTQSAGSILAASTGNATYLGTVRIDASGMYFP